MKHNDSFFAAALMVLALAISPLSNASAQEPNQPSQSKTGKLQATLSSALKSTLPGAVFTGFEKEKKLGTNEVYKVQFTCNGTNMLARITGDGTLLTTDQPANIHTFPVGAKAAVRKAITGMGIKDLGVRLRHTYAEIQPESSNAFQVVTLPEPRVTYGANVRNNHGQPGRFEFTADGALVKSPSWAQ